MVAHGKPDFIVNSKCKLKMGGNNKHSVFHDNKIRVLCSLLVVMLTVVNNVSANINKTKDESKDSGVVDPSVDTLQQVHVIFRHGLRSPEKPYPGDPYNETSDWPQGWGQLTNLGKKQQFELGQYIRQRYKHFLGVQYSPLEFQASSSDSDRTIMSLLANLAGIFPPTVNDTWNDENQLQGWQPIPFRTIPREVDRIIQAKARCPRMDKEWGKVLASQEFLDCNKRFQDLYEYIGHHTGEKYSYPVQLTTFYEALIIQEAHNLTSPEWTRRAFPTEESAEFLGFAFSLAIQTEEMKRLGAGPLLTQILTNLKSKMRKQSELKMVMFSGHDMTIVRLLGVINAFILPHLPDFNSVVMIELHKNQSYSEKGSVSGKSACQDHECDDQFYIQAFYRNGTMDLVQLEMVGCEEPCTIKKFETVFHNRLLTKAEWTRECFQGYNDNNPELATVTDKTEGKGSQTSKPSSVTQYESTYGFWSNFYNAFRYWFL